MLFGGVYILWPDPLIVGAMGVNELEFALTRTDAEEVLYWPAWNWTARTVPSLVKARWASRKAGKRLAFIANSVPQDRLLRRLGFPGRLASLNAYVNEHVFTIRPSAKVHDAIYVSQMASVKRLGLAGAIDRLYVVTYGECRDAEGRYDLHRFEPAVGHADFNRGWISSPAIAEHFNASCVNLALSAEEGAMLAVVEGLLCGVPLVSTPCKGGREVFFDDRFVRIAQPNPQAIREAVMELKSARVDPEMVRAETIDRIALHRSAIGDEVAAAVRRSGGPPVLSQEVVARFFGAGGSAEHFVDFKDAKFQR
jgi:glycosyltransferase involved in cell wall biosynthesis